MFHVKQGELTDGSYVYGLYFDDAQVYCAPSKEVAEEASKVFSRVLETYRDGGSLIDVVAAVEGVTEPENGVNRRSLAL